MKSIIIAVTIAALVCLLIELKKKMGIRPLNPSDFDENGVRKPSLLKRVFFVVLFVCILGVPLLWYLSSQTDIDDTAKTVSDREPSSFSLETPKDIITETGRVSSVETIRTETDQETVADQKIQDQPLDDKIQIPSDTGHQSDPGSDAAEVKSTDQEMAGPETLKPDQTVTLVPDESAPDISSVKGSIQSPSSSEDKPPAAASGSIEEQGKTIERIRPPSVTVKPAREMEEESSETIADAGTTASESMGTEDIKGDYPYSILIGTYETPERAYAIASSFLKKGDPAFTTFYADPYEGSVYQVFIGNYASYDDVQVKANELRKRNFRQVDITTRMFAVQVVACASYNISEPIKEKLKSMGHMPYTVSCKEGYGKSSVLVGAFLNDVLAEKAVQELRKNDLFPEANVVLR